MKRTRDVTALLLLLLAFVGAIRLWHDTRNSVGVDFYQFWAVGRLLAKSGPVDVYTDEGREEISLPPHQGRAAELIELRDALQENRDVFPDGEWGKTNLEICLALHRSSREGKDISLKF